MMQHWIWLATRSGIGDRVKVSLLRHFLDPEAVYNADPEEYDPVEGMNPAGKESLMDKDLAGAEKILLECERKDLQILTFHGEGYPQRLKHIPDPPVVLYYKGSIPKFDEEPVIGVVGTRKASLYGLQSAQKLGYQIARCGGLVVSGLAEGIDGLAMQGALMAGAPTVGILGCGADLVYPRSNGKLFADTERYGCIMSEFPPGTPPYRQNFPRRNRIISGLSCGVLVVEAPQKSGALITAEDALEQGRDVFVVPGNIDSDTCVGSNRLLRAGALAVSTGWDVVSEYEGLFPDKLHEVKFTRELPPVSAVSDKPAGKVAQKPLNPVKNKTSKQKIDKKVIDKPASSPYIDLNEILPKLNGNEQKIVRELAQGPKLTDEVVAGTGLGTGTVLAALTMLEIKGIVKRLPGKQVSLSADLAK